MYTNEQWYSYGYSDSTIQLYNQVDKDIIQPIVTEKLSRIAIQLSYLNNNWGKDYVEQFMTKSEAQMAFVLPNIPISELTSRSIQDDLLPYKSSPFYTNSRAGICITSF